MAIKTIKRKITDLDRSKIEEQKKAVRSGYDMDIIPSDLATYGEDAKNLLRGLQKNDEHMFLVTPIIVNLAESKQELNNQVLQILHLEEKVDLLPANTELAGLEVSLVNAMSREKILKQCLEPLKRYYDYILIDCMPSLGMLTIMLWPLPTVCLFPLSRSSFPPKVGAAPANGEQGSPPDPGDFGGHSLSVSDSVAIKQAGHVSCYYCDSFGFKELPDFRKPENYLKAAELSTEDDYGIDSL